MVSIADIPFMGTTFKGIICIVWYKSYEYRLATYNGAKILECSKNKIVVKNRKYKIDITIENEKSHALYAPQKGKMNRIIKENPSCMATFKFYENDNLLFNLISPKTSFEYV